ncbi:hypothetical protein DO97_16220 [Neosynechococcus sphagnicola sy1]|uniref:Uncharacterized protein n=1 Tax=Neosynechococcus sphagnicola sy1 TaxID=1497020 RepID=A0A098TLI9_9CYAN|nr:hypothetical protein [Neosynechococcus sphagnicola]KGF71713.1 hypothetical protein DO97_16220 [Neosynechococcus sphagnicola sy1]
MPKGNPKPIITPEFEANKIKRSDDTTDPLAQQQLQVRVGQDVDNAIRKLGNQKTEWLRRVITEAAKRELMGFGEGNLSEEEQQ